MRNITSGSTNIAKNEKTNKDETTVEGWVELTDMLGVNLKLWGGQKVVKTCAILLIFNSYISRENVGKM